MPTSPLLSILIPHYNAQHTLPRMLDSILAQSLKSLEVIVVDDGSQESCREMIDAWRERGLDVRLIEHNANKGTKEARLTGIEHAQGRAIFFADADDLLLGTEALEQHVRLLLREEADIVHFNAVARDSNTDKEYFSVNQRPFATILNGEEVFAAYAGSLHGGTLWNKLFVGRLCRSCLPEAKSLAMTRFSEDFYLTVLFFSQARRYRGSALAGYHYAAPHAHVAETRWAGRIHNLYAIAEWFVVLLRDQNFSPALITAFQMKVANNMLMYIAKLEHAASTDAGAYNRDVLQKLCAGVNMTVLERALEFALTQSSGMSKTQCSLKLRNAISKRNHLKVSGHAD